MKVIVFGGAGFIGSHFVDLISVNDLIDQILIIDELTYAGNVKYINKISENKKIKFIKCNILEIKNCEVEFRNFDLAVNFAAETHVDRSIANPKIFFDTNIIGTQNLLDSCMRMNVKKYLQVSTDEVYGSVNQSSKETDVLNPSSPYSSSKAGGDLLALAYWKTYGFPVMVTRGCNTYGPRQFPEKFIPLAINNLNNGKKIPIYGSGQQIREWIHVEDHALGIWQIAKSMDFGEIFNIGSGEKFSNLQIVTILAQLYNKEPNSVIEYVQDRLGHDFSYSLDSKKIKEKFNWSPKRKFIEEIGKLRDWRSV